MVAALSRAGADIRCGAGACGLTGGPHRELNTVRKALSSVKGGRLAELAAPATVLTLVLSDVIGEWKQLADGSWWSKNASLLTTVMIYLFPWIFIKSEVHIFTSFKILGEYRRLEI